VQDVSDGTLRLIGMTEFVAARVDPCGDPHRRLAHPARRVRDRADRGPGRRGPRAPRRARAIAANVFLLALAVLVAWGRFGPYSF